MFRGPFGTVWGARGVFWGAAGVHMVRLGVVLHAIGVVSVCDRALVALLYTQECGSVRALAHMSHPLTYGFRCIMPVASSPAVRAQQCVGAVSICARAKHIDERVKTSRHTVEVARACVTHGGSSP